MNETLLTLKVANKTVEADGICSFELVDPHGAALPAFEAGAHIDVHLPGLIRQYSLSNDPRETHRYRIAGDTDHVLDRRSAEAFDEVGKVAGGVGAATVPRRVRRVGQRVGPHRQCLDLLGELLGGKRALADRPRPALADDFLGIGRWRSRPTGPITVLRNSWWSYWDHTHDVSAIRPISSAPASSGGPSASSALSPRRSCRSAGSDRGRSSSGASSCKEAAGTSASMI